MSLEMLFSFIRLQHKTPVLLEEKAKTILHLSSIALNKTHPTPSFITSTPSKRNQMRVWGA